MNSFKKILRYIAMYGFRRTLVKVLYRTDLAPAYFILKALYSNKRKSDKRIAFIGMGNHGFTLLAFFVAVIAKQRISLVIDPSSKSKKLSKKVLSSKHYDDIESAILDKEFYGDIVYIASDHFSHTDHARISSKYFKNIYVEKPLFVDFEQMKIYKDILSGDCNIYTGFNRPYSAFFKDFISIIDRNFSITMIVNGHFLPADHWYRNKDQGSRVLGNMTHWIDLSLHIFNKYGADNLKIELSSGKLDDLVLIMSSSAGKICISFSANSEPSDGVEEYLFWNCPSSNGNIINFRKIYYVTQDGFIKRKSRLAKDAGHKLASLAPLNGSIEDGQISYKSSALALKVEEMYVDGVNESSFNLN